jgi:hypothetical protein
VSGELSSGWTLLFVSIGFAVVATALLAAAILIARRRRS